MIKDDEPHYLLDTNIVSEIVKYAPEFSVIKKISEHVSDMAISVLSWHELVYGVENLPDGIRKRELAKFVYDDVEQTFPMKNFSKEAAEIHAKIRASLETKGSIPPYSDTQIAAIAIAENMILVTRNTKHYESIASQFGLKMENWFED